jgi:hypothetical protein
MVIIADLKTDTGQSLGQVAAPSKVFKTGSRGFYANTKVEIDGKRYQVSIQLVEIGSKPPAEEEK